jgi:uncharacterized membrane protein YagU involved in acid resistance
VQTGVFRLTEEKPMKRENRELLTGVLLGGLLAGAVDIAAASLIYGRNPALIAQSIAAGLLGKAAFAGGARTVILGTVLQEAMGILIAAIYAVLLRSAPALRRRWIASGLAYGIIIFFVMNYIVVPLSALRSKPHFNFESFAENMAAMLLFGLIVAFFFQAQSRDERTAVQRS